ncbi:TPA_exp: putative GPI anchored protein [Trichophyton benhamiae CBS 112371]|nr:TPA_exp: putative GPI anchored protein [Trichophyton benhamiae CBS 112371]
MKISVSSFLAFSTLIYHSTLATTLKPSRKDTLESWNSVQARHLSPAYPHGGLRKRQPGKILGNEARLDFVDHFTHVTARSNDPVLYATLNMRSNHPVLSIEDLEDGLVDVTCSEEGIKLTFSTSQYMEQVSKELGNTDEFVAISSHWGCNEKEERAPHMITGITVNKDENSVLLSRKDVQWKEAFHSIDVSFSHKKSSSVVRRSQKPVNPNRRRSGTRTPEESPTSTVRDVVFPGVPSNIPYLKDGGGRISVNHKGRKLVPLDSDITNILGLPEGVTLSCKECSINGDVVLSTGSFSITSTDDSGLVSTLAFISEGRVDIELSRVFARMELELALEAGKELLNFTVPMPSAPLSPFTIPQVVDFGAILVPQVSVEVALSKPLNLTYGVDISVPEDSFISLNFGSPANSTIKGLQHTTFTEIPFQSPQAITDLTFSVSFSPEILFGLRSPTGIISGGAGVAFNMPQASVKVSQLDDVNEVCEKIPHAPGIEDDMTKKDSLFGNFTRVEPSLEFNVIPFIEMQLDLPRGEVLQQLEATVTSTQLSLPTACLAFDQKMSTYGAPTQVLATSTAGPTATASEAKKGAAGRSGVANTWSVLCISVLVSAVFIAM